MQETLREMSKHAGSRTGPAALAPTALRSRDEHIGFYLEQTPDVVVVEANNGQTHFTFGSMGERQSNQ